MNLDSPRSPSHSPWFLFDTLSLSSHAHQLKHFTTPKYQKTLSFLNNSMRKGDVFYESLDSRGATTICRGITALCDTCIFRRTSKRDEICKRKRKFSGSDLAAICIWISQRVASDPLVRLCSRLHAATGTLLSPEGLNKRLNAKAVLFLQHLFSLLLQQKVCEHTQISNQLFAHFERIRIMDATMFQVPNALEHVYPGSGGCAQTAGIKIQLEYDLHSGQFLNFQVGPGKNNDKTFGTECLDTLRPGDLCIRDLGYFSLEDLDQMDQRGTYFISRLKLNTNVYIKNPNPTFFSNGTLKKQTEYVKINLQMMMERLLPGEMYEVGNVYVGDQKVLFARLVLYRLTEKQLRERRKKQMESEKKKGKPYSKKSKILSGLNVYVTNTPWEWVSMKQVHELYSLRWQIEIVFKTWKSLFHIDHCRTVKQERIECHLYGKLIAIFLC